MRNVTIFADAEVDRSPCGTGTAAVMAVLDEMGLLAGRRPVRAREHRRHARSPGRVVDRVQVGEKAAIVPEIEGSAWITGEHTFLIDGDDPAEGRISSLTYFIAAILPKSIFPAKSRSVLTRSHVWPSIGR